MVVCKFNFGFWKDGFVFGRKFLRFLVVISIFFIIMWVLLLFFLFKFILKVGWGILNVFLLLFLLLNLMWFLKYGFIFLNYFKLIMRCVFMFGLYFYMRKYCGVFGSVRDVF